MHLITYRLKGVPIPDVLPQTLLSTLPPITAEERKRYSETFRKADQNNEKFINGEQARKLFGKSGLDTTVLAKIWFEIDVEHSNIIRTLSDQDKDHQLSENEFILALYLINSKLKGCDIPDVLPKVVIDSIFVASTPTPAPTPKEALKPNYDIKLDDLATPQAPAQPAVMPTGLVPPTHLLPSPVPAPAAAMAVQAMPTPVVPVSAATTPAVQPSFGVTPAPAVPVSQPSFVVRTASVDPKQIAALETRKEELTKELVEEQTKNQQIEQELAAENENLNKLQEEVKQLQTQVTDEKTKGNKRKL